MSSASSKSSVRSRSAPAIVSVLMLFVVTAVFLPGCRKGGPEPEPPGDSVENTAIISLETTFDGLLPDEFEFNVPRDLPTSDLNEWGEVMLSDMVDQEVDEKKLADSLSKVLPEETVERVLRQRFVLQDSTHLRDCLWARELMQSVIEGSKTETDRIVDLFYFVVNTIQIVPNEQTLPFGPFEMALYGRGTAEDRAWALAFLLRQQRIPTVVFVEMKPAGDETTDDKAEDVDSRKSLIVGALLSDSFYLFDVGLGLPIPGPDDDGTSTLIRTPATLSQVLKEPALLSNLSGGDESAYGMTAEHLKSLQPQVIGDSSLWARRMEGLQNGLPGEVKASIFEPLVSYGIYEGVIDQISEHMNQVLPDATVGVWDYPELQRERRELVNGNSEQASVLADLEQTFDVPNPIIVSVDRKEPGKLTIDFGPSWSTHRSGRVEQITGRPEKAIPAYLKVQSWRTLPPSPKDAPDYDPALEPLIVQKLPQDVRLRHLLAAEEALIWRATCQLQKKDYASAAIALEGYLRQLATRVYPGRFNIEANYLAGVSLALSGNSRRGMAFLRNVTEGSARYAVSQSLIARWSAQAENSEK